VIYKKFNKENHKANDKPAKDLVIKFLQSKGLDAIENPNDYGIDIMVSRYEVERRIIWKDKFPFKTVHIPSRKSKFLKYNIMYAVVNKDFDKIMLCKSSTIRKYKQIEVPNKSVPKGEYFYDVPIEEWSIYKV
tara:strand:+ start:3115 stop:3513 length:399 start_codon:yes stop_codon:yes gene_type:complete